MKALDRIILWASINCPELYEEYLIDKHEEEHGPHFTEDTAKKVVDNMYHHSGNTLYKSEHWSIEQIREVIKNYKNYLAETVTDWDVYVALHMWWHDLELSYKKHGLSDAYLIEDALAWTFMDEDAKDGKIWRYIKSMK